MKRKVAVIADGTTAVPQELVNEYDIGVLPFHVIVDGQDYLESEVDMDWLLNRLRQRGDLPTTSAPSIGEALRAYEWAAKRADSAISIHLTSVFSKSYEAALEARALALEKYPHMQIEVVDSRTAEAGELAIVADTARLAMQGADFHEVVQKAYEVRDNLCLLYCFETLFYRNKGGRVFKAKPWAEAESRGATGLKALVEVDHSTGGTMQPVCRAKTKTQLLKKMVRMASDRINEGKLSGAIVHVNAAEDAFYLQGLLRDEVACEHIHVSHASAGSCVHGGDGFVTFGFHNHAGQNHTAG